MQLSDRTIKNLLSERELSIDPMPEDIQFQPATVDLRLAKSMRGLDDMIDFGNSHGYKLQPQQFVLGCTMEVIGLGPQHAARVEGKSTLARLGVMVHCAGFVDPGFYGQITLEMFNLSDRAVLLEPGMLICQIAFYELDLPVERQYGDNELGSHYQGQRGAVQARGLR